ncbi:MAG TPA: L,D-transpeptidase family protein [Polyangiaceae bacterium]|nr:L,D-transpeptidase family protein [Polyangiaceae bacterium]
MQLLSPHLVRCGTLYVAMGIFLSGLGLVSCSHEPHAPPETKNTPRLIASGASAELPVVFQHQVAPLPRWSHQGVPDDALQAIVVTSPSWKSYHGQLRRFERQDYTRAWNRADAGAVAVSLGRYGLGWGRGLHPEQKGGPVKGEGDHRSPAGIFDLGEAGGFAKELPPGTTWPFQQSANRSRCMDNPRSIAYNTFISTEAMLLPVSVGVARRETVFEMMLFVMHNTSPVLRGAGSCVFLHVWAKPESPTQGCVAMSRESLQRILPWLDLERRPVLVQLPEHEYRRFEKDWSLPTLDPEDSG